MTDAQIDQLLQWYCAKRAAAERREIQNKEQFMAEVRRIIAEDAQERAKANPRPIPLPLPKIS